MTNTTTGRNLLRRPAMLVCWVLTSLALLPLAFEREAAAALNETQKTERALEFITKNGTAIAEIMADESMPKQEKRFKMKDILEKNLDLKTMTRAIVGAYWRKMTEPQRERYKEASKQWVVLYSANFLSTVKSSKFDVLAAKPLGKDVLVETEALAKRSPNPLTIHWRVRFKPDDQAILIDMHFRGLSMIAAQRGEVSAVLAEQGIPAFLDLLDKRVKKIKLEFNKR